MAGSAVTLPLTAPADGEQPQEKLIGAARLLQDLQRLASVQKPSHPTMSATAPRNTLFKPCHWMFSDSDGFPSQMQERSYAKHAREGLRK